MQKLSVEDFIKAPYSRILIPDGEGSYSAEILELPGCFAQGDNPNEAYANLEEAAKSWIQASLDRGLEIPPPAMNQSYGGKIALRIPRSLHRKAAQFAERDATSLNQFLITAIASRIGAEEYHSSLWEKFEQRLSNTITNNYYIQGEMQWVLPSNVAHIGVEMVAGVQLQQATVLPTSAHITYTVIALDAPSTPGETEIILDLYPNSDNAWGNSAQGGN